MRKVIQCNCGVSYTSGNRKKHEVSKFHTNFMNNNKSIENADENIEVENENENEIITDDISEPDDFLECLDNDQYVSQTQIDEQKEEQEKLNKEQEKLNKEQEKQYNKQERKNKEHDRQIKALLKEENKPRKVIKEVFIKNDDDDELFSDKATAIHGKDKLQLIKKAQQYKLLFKNELKNFKIKKNASKEDLQIAIDEMSNLLETSSTDEFVMDGILSSLQVVENLTAMTKNYNLVGLSQTLKMNKEFNSLAKQLMLKYGSFQAISPEYKMMFVVFTSCYIVRNRNKNKDSLNEFLNQEYHPQNENQNENQNIIL